MGQQAKVSFRLARERRQEPLLQEQERKENQLIAGCVSERQGKRHLCRSIQEMAPLILRGMS